MLRDVLIPGGRVKICEYLEYGPYSGTTIRLEIREEDGGLTLPSGMNIYTELSPVYWSSHYSFLHADMNVKGHTRFKTRLTKTKQRTILIREPAILELSDIFYDLLIAGQLPMRALPTAYLMDRKAVMYDYSDKFKAVEIALADLNTLSLKGTEKISEQVGHKNALRAAQYRPVQF